MTVLEALNSVESKAQHLPISIPTHVQLKRIIDLVRKEAEGNEEVKDLEVVQAKKEDE